MLQQRNEFGLLCYNKEMFLVYYVTTKKLVWFIMLQQKKGVWFVTIQHKMSLGIYITTKNEFIFKSQQRNKFVFMIQKNDLGFHMRTKNLFYYVTKQRNEFVFMLLLQRNEFGLICYNKEMILVYYVTTKK